MTIQGAGMTKKEYEAMTKDEFDKYRKANLGCDDCRFYRFGCNEPDHDYPIAPVCDYFEWW